ncbi:MAG: hypothetical protein OEZ25_03595 [Candidatus Bathyarchaeota archaeon]|nr:hypothetical protein [Candidatus Bathyarchaeota archaeon]
MSNKKKILLVGDNPFHGISHLSQERARVRGDSITHGEYAAKLVMTSLDNGAQGFMFSVSEITLSILKVIRETGKSKHLRLYALVPYAYEYVRLATQIGISGLAKKFAKQIVLSGNVRSITMGLKGIAGMDPIALMKAYLTYEISRIKSSAGREGKLDSVFLHEIITDMALALDLDWLFKSYVDFVSQLGIQPGFETRNFACLVNKFREWSMDFREIVIATPFNKVGFQMNPSKTECEKALRNLPESNIVAISILAAGYLKPSEAINYIRTLPELKGVVAGVSKEHHARETFKLLEKNLV